VSISSTAHSPQCIQEIRCSPPEFDAALKQSESFQNFSLYNTSGTLSTDQTNASVGNRRGDLPALVTFNTPWLTAASLAFGIDNIFNDKYFLFHPFPRRTYVVQGRLQF
jgi:hypothetical protein